jgi:hypothetical protein
MVRRHLDLWLPTYLASAPYRFYRRLRRPSRHTHIIFLVCDHFEPRHAARTVEQSTERVKAWHTGYARFQQRCRTDFGTAPLHTWFYPPHHGNEHLASLAAMAHDGLGEVELHYHHDGDTEATLEHDLRTTLAEYNRWGLLLESGEQPRTSFGFIHGDWALGNSGHGKHCGVNNELTILQKLGCWADLTMPSTEECQTRKINSIYYARGSRDRPKSHDWGPNARVHSPDPEGLMLIQGPLGINWGAPSYPRIENASLTSENWGRPDRIRKWIDCHVHVRGRPEWLFVKLHTHGAIEKDFDALFGDRGIEMHRVLNQEYNDGKRYSLHYVTARQAYNIVRAAEHGHGGNPSDYLDYEIPQPATAHYAANVRHTLDHCTAGHLKLSGIENGQAARIRMRVGPIATLYGAVSAFEVDTHCKRICIDATGTVDLSLRDGTTVDIVEGGERLSGDHYSVPIAIAGRCTLSYR